MLSDFLIFRFNFPSTTPRCPGIRAVEIQNLDSRIFRIRRAKIELLQLQIASFRTRLFVLCFEFDAARRSVAFYSISLWQLEQF